MRVLTFTTLYPNASQPRHGVFIEQRVRQLCAFAGDAVQACVVAPVPWFPFTSARFGQYGVFASVPDREQRHGLDVLHPRYVVIPKVGMGFAPALLAAGARGALQRVRDEGFDFDVIDAHFLYPDGIAALQLGREFERPVVLSARGTDVHTYSELPAVWPRIVAAAGQAAHVVTVSDALRATLLRAGVESQQVTTLRNGVDTNLFRPPDRELARRELGLDRVTLLSVGNLVPVKGHELTIRALAELPDCDLLIVGDGPERDALLALAASLGLERRVRLLPVVPQERLARVYGACDLLVLASLREGWPNVLLEAMACGTPVVAADIPGTREIVSAAAAGLVFEQRTPAALSAACRQLLENGPDRDATRRYAMDFGWQPTCEGLLRVLNAALTRH